MKHRDSAVYSRVVQRFPWWLTAVFALMCIGLGAVLVTRPFASLGMLIVLLSIGLILAGASEILQSVTGEHSAPQVVRGIISIIAGLAIVLLPGLTISALTITVGLALIGGGLVRGWSVWKGTWDDRLSDVLLGAVSIILGILALTWRDVTVLLIAAIFGAAMVLFGIDQLAHSIRSARGRQKISDSSAPARMGLVRRFARTTGSALALVVAAALVTVSLRLSGSPTPDDFYVAPTDMPVAAGTLIRSEEFTTDIPTGAIGWRILYSTTRDDAVPAVASAIVVVPDDGATDRDVIAWAHGTTGYAEGCAPSLLEHPLEAGAMPDLDQALARGWGIVATDYTGLGTQGPHPYLIGQGEGRSILDAVRAAQQLEHANLGEQTAIWGHSQGGHAALWAGGLAARYAPEINLVGVAAMAPASNLPELLAGLSTSAAGGVFGSFVIVAYSATYPDVSFDAYVRPGARIAVQEMATRCLTDPSTLVSVATAVLSNDPVWSGDPATGALRARPRQYPDQPDPRAVVDRARRRRHPRPTQRTGFICSRPVRRRPSR